MAGPDQGPGKGPGKVDLIVGRIGKAHGLRGEVSVESRTDDPERRFAAGSVLLTEPAERGPLTVTGAHDHSGRLLLTFEGVDDRDAAEALRGTLLVAVVDEDDSPDDPDEYYDHQLVGLTVVTIAGEELGEVADMLHLPAQDVFAVRRPDGRELLVPFVAEIVPEVDLAGRRVVVAPPPGLLDLDET